MVCTVQEAVSYTHLMSVVGDRAVAHGREQNGFAQGELRGLIGNQLAVRPAQDAARLLAQKNAGLHGLAPVSYTHLANP